jgi:manganese/zinc/iron transport system ATP- binding protein
MIEHAPEHTPQPPATGAEHPADAPLSIHDMTVAYHRKPVLWDVDYDAPAGKLVAIVGPNGAGKSTLIKACLDLVPRASGMVRFFGEPYADVRRRVAYVPQRGSVDWDFPIDALGVVAMGLYRQIAAAGRGRRSPASACRTTPTDRSASSPAGSSSGCSWPARWCRGRTCT